MDRHGLPRVPTVPPAAIVSLGNAQIPIFQAIHLILPIVCSRIVLANVRLSGYIPFHTYAYGAVSPRDGAADFLILPVMTAVAMKVFLDELARRHDGQYILMIYDGAPCHSPGALNIPDTMTVRTLPPYSPQLNPVENIWDDMREKFFANIVFESMDAVENKISEACLHYEENTETVRSITAFPWIDDNL